jgi:hypothetical protein
MDIRTVQYSVMSRRPIRYKCEFISKNLRKFMIMKILRALNALEREY